ncbi:MAG: hypothetical protein QG673_928 [Pseudomonadota bacterium]|nr:hypothetical protein [Pseudomonadota bacterium]
MQYSHSFHSARIMDTSIQSSVGGSSYKLLKNIQRNIQSQTNPSEKNTNITEESLFQTTQSLNDQRNIQSQTNPSEKNNNITAESLFQASQSLDDQRNIQSQTNPSEKNTNITEESLLQATQSLNDHYNNNQVKNILAYALLMLYDFAQLFYPSSQNTSVGIDDIIRDKDLTDSDKKKGIQLATEITLAISLAEDNIRTTSSSAISQKHSKILIYQTQDKSCKVYSKYNKTTKSIDILIKKSALIYSKDEVLWSVPEDKLDTLLSMSRKFIINNINSQTIHKFIKNLNNNKYIHAPSAFVIPLKIAELSQKIANEPTTSDKQSKLIPIFATVAISELKEINPQLIISRKFSSQYCKLIKGKNPTYRTFFTTDVPKIREELLKFKTPEEKLKYLDGLVETNKLFKKSVSYKFPQKCTELQKLHVYNERIDFICNALYKENNTPEESVQVQEWTCSHVGASINAAGIDDKYFSVYPDDDNDGASSTIERRAPKISTELEEDPAYDKTVRKRPPFISMAIPFAGNFFGLHKQGLQKGIADFNSNNSAVNHRDGTYYTYLSKYHNCVGAVRYIFECGLVNTFTSFKSSTLGITNPKYMLAYVYDINHNISKLNQKCEFLQTCVHANVLKGNPKKFDDLKLKNLFDKYTELKSKEGDYADLKIKLLKEMVEHVYDQITAGNLDKISNHNINDIFTQINEVYSEAIQTPLVKDCQEIEYLRNKHEDKFINVIAELSQKYEDYTPDDKKDKIAAILTDLYYTAPTSLVPALQSLYQDNEKVIAQLNRSYFYCPQELVTSLKLVFNNNNKEIASILAKTIYSYEPKQLVNALKLLYGNQSDDTIADQLFLLNSTKTTVEALQFLYKKDPNTNDRVRDKLIEKQFPEKILMSFQLLYDIHGDTAISLDIVNALVMKYRDEPEQFKNALLTLYRMHTTSGLVEIIPMVHELYTTRGQDLPPVLQNL